MSTPKPFQEATIQAALRAFDGRRAVRRFLVADEVGLGKTVVAREVLRRLVARKRRAGDGPLKVFYVCSSLAIAGQNQTSLLKALDDADERARASAQVDRLTLLPNRELPSDVPLHLLTLTPDTSLPDRGGKRRDGTAKERALLHRLLEARYGDLVRHDGEDWLRRTAVKSWPHWLSSDSTAPRSGLADTFFVALRRELGLQAGQHLPPVLRREVARDPLALILHLRVALARAGLDQMRPDLVIFDEFQRFSDLLRGDDRGSAIAREMVRAGRDGPAVLLLSATPFRLFGGELETAFDGAPHHEQFFGLVEWLLGGADRPASAAERHAIEARFGDFARGLRSADPTGAATLEAKHAIEEQLRRVMARTERFGHALGHDAARPFPLEAPLDADDLAIFRHHLACFRGSDDDSRQVGATVPYWTSVPLAMQTLGPRYKAWRAASLLAPERQGLYVRRRDVKRFRGPTGWAHPRLRALRAAIPPERLALPWLPPSMPWWALSGPWADAPPEKVLLFSRFRATPRAVAALLSYDVERHLLAGSDTTYAKATEKVLLGPSRENLAFFHPSPALIELLDPAQLLGLPPDRLRASARALLREALRTTHGVTLTRAARPPRPLPELLVALERRTGSAIASHRAWQQLAVSVGKGVGEHGLRTTVDEWWEADGAPLDRLTAEEFDRLVDAGLAGAGPVLGRSLRRHGLAPEGDGLLRMLKTAWRGLRSYLNNPWMEASLRRATQERTEADDDYRAHVRAAALDGGLESVLDEHLWITRTLRGGTPSEAAKELENALSLRTSTVLFHGLGGRQDVRLRAHAALPFSARVSAHRPGTSSEERGAAARQGDLRTAFNSPFWPHVLASTSVGQEGLDFHAWCARIAHWDLPSNPVDLEQREGRVDRYGGLAVRRALARSLALDASSSPPGTSPWAELAERADAQAEGDEAGLAPWWVCQGAAVERMVFEVPLSEATAHLDTLKTRRMLYRLALGQPDQEDLVDALQGRVDAEQARALTLDLSPWRYARDG